MRHTADRRLHIIRGDFLDAQVRHDERLHQLLFVDKNTMHVTEISSAMNRLVRSPLLLGLPALLPWRLRFESTPNSQDSVLSRPTFVVSLWSHDEHLGLTWDTSFLLYPFPGQEW